MALGSNVIITRSLGPAARGSFDVMVVLLSLMLLVTSFSIETANVYYGAKDTTRIPVLIGNSLVAALSFGSLGALIFLWLSGWAPLQNYLIDNSIAPAQLSAFMAILPLFLAAAYLREIVRSAGDIVRYNLAALLQAVVYLIGSILFVFILQLNILGAILAFSMAQISLCLYVLFVALRIAGWRIRLGWSDFIPTFRYGFQLYPGMIAQFLNYRVDMLLVAYFMTPTFVGYYALAVSLAEKIFEIPHAIRTALLHRVAQS
ncbi:MAG TPA: oligosaccharide flippase family protein, partial [Caldilineaceae bacterium]|nr:oligosaccharide flippase family protein [Caldilineaceae bacterium]